MKEILTIFRRDMKAIITNYAALIVVIALCILPSLYAWFNIKASWDPYGEKATSGIKVGVVNLDQPIKVSGKDYNIGVKLVSELKKSKALGWKFLSQNEAKKALKEEKLFAVITIPANFSKNLTSIISPDITKGEIIYTVNEKMNPIAPKLTDKGVSALQNTVSQTVVETVSKTILQVANDVGADLEKQIPNITKAYDELKMIQGKFGEINDTVATGEVSLVKLKSLLADINTALPKVNETIINAQSLGGEVKTFLATSKNLSGKIAPIIVTDLTVIANVSHEVTSQLTALQGSISDNLTQAPVIIGQIQSKLTTMQSMLQSVTTLLKRFGESGNSNALNNMITRLTTASDKISALNTKLNTVKGLIGSDPNAAKGALTTVINTAASIETICNTIVKEANANLIPQMNSIFSTANKVIDETMAILETAKAKLPDVSDLVLTANKASDKGEKGIAEVKRVLPKAESLVNEFVTKLKGVNDEKNLRSLVEMLTANVAERSDFLVNPVNVKEERIYAMRNYGTSMTPFYTVLSLWVGLLLLGSMLTVESEGHYKPYQVYFGKLLLYLLITILQALIVSLGCLYILKIYCRHPAVYVLGSVLTSVTFTFIVYTLVSILGNVGKVIGIILLVVQVAGSGGTFPVQLTPRFFQVLNPFMPFTYAISFCRESIGGIVSSLINRDLLVFAAFIGGSIIFALLLKGPINERMHRFTTRFKESGIGE